MSVQLGMDDDWYLLDHRETVILKIEGQADRQLIDCAISEPVEWRELEPTGGQVLRRGTLFVWPKGFSPSPPIGSVVLDSDGQYWTVWKLTKKQHVETYEPVCIDLSIVTVPANTATILKATYEKGDANEAVAVWVGLVSGDETPTSEDTVPAHFQPSEETTRMWFGADYTDILYRVTFEREVPMTTIGAEYRLVDNDGKRYRVLKYFNESRIDKLPVAIAAEIIEGAEYDRG